MIKFLNFRYIPARRKAYSMMNLIERETSFDGRHHESLQHDIEAEPSTSQIQMSRSPYLAQSLTNLPSNSASPRYYKVGTMEYETTFDSSSSQHKPHDSDPKRRGDAMMPMQYETTFDKTCNVEHQHKSPLLTQAKSMVNLHSYRVGVPGIHFHISN